jgi:hypothetical protein
MTDIVSFYRFIPGCRLPQRADRAAGGSIPTRAFRYCEPIATASAFGWYMFPPMNFSLLWDGTEVFWRFEGDDSWYPLRSAQYPGFSDYFDSLVPEDVRGFAPPFLGAPIEPGLVQMWSGFFARTKQDWSLLIRPVANLARNQGYEFYEGIVETDCRFGPLFTNLRLTRTNVPVVFSSDIPVFQVQPLHRSVYADATLDGMAVIPALADLKPDDWEQFRQTIVFPNSCPHRHKGEYAKSVRKRRLGEPAGRSNDVSGKAGKREAMQP